MVWMIRFAMVAIFPRSGTLPGIADTDIDTFLKRLLSESPLLVRLGLYAAAFVFMVSPLFTVFLPVPAVALSGRLLVRHTDKIVHTRIYALQQMMVILKVMGGLCWGADPRVREVLGVETLPEDPASWRGSMP